MKRVSARDFAAFLDERAKAKDGYIMGGVGQSPKQLSAWWFNQYKNTMYSYAIYWKNHAERVWDCNGLAEGYYKDVTGASINTRARYNYANWCGVKGTGMIPANMRVKGAAVFWGTTAKNITHVAFLTRPVNPNDPAGDWVLTEARNVKVGVVQTLLSERLPAYWGLMDKYFDYGSDIKPDKALIVTGNSVNVRKGPSTGYESVGSVNKGDLLSKVETDGWTCVLYDENIMWISSKYVKEAV